MTRSILLLLPLLCLTKDVCAQTAANPSPPVWNAFTLQGWDEMQRTSIFDRRGARYGYLSDRGVFQRFTPGMTDEYDLNIFSYGFSLQQDYLWYRNDNGFRVYSGRQSDLTTSVYSQFKTEALVAGKTKVGVEVTTENDVRSNRGFVVLSARQEFANDQSAGIYYTVSEYQQDADLGLVYRSGHPQTGFFKVEVAALDFTNNQRISSINSSVSGADTLRYYSRNPYYAGISYVSPVIQGFHVEAFTGFLTPSTAEIAPKSNRTRRFERSEAADFQGFLIDYVKNSVTIGFSFQREFSRTSIDTLASSIYFDRYNSSQVQRTVGLHFMLTSNEYVLESSVLNMLQRDRQDGTSFVVSPTYSDSLDFRATRFLVRNRIMRRPFFSGLVAGLEYAGDFRAPGNDALRMRFWSNSLHDVNQRLTFISGWHFNPRAWFHFGYSIDLDADYHRTPGGEFKDGAFFRLGLRW